MRGEETKCTAVYTGLDQPRIKEFSFTAVLLYMKEYREERLTVKREWLFKMSLFQSNFTLL